MSLFKTTRDQLKANAFVSNLELAKAKFRPNDFTATALHIKWAVKAMEKIKNAKAEDILSRTDWLHVIEICEELGEVLREAGQEELCRACVPMYEWALQNEDQIAEGGLLSAVESTLSKDPSTAIPLLESAAAEGDGEAQFLMGQMYVSGEGTLKDLSKAIELFARAAAQGNIDAHFSLGVIHANGMGTPKDERKAIEFFETAAAEGHAGALFNLGAIYAAGEGIPKNERRGLELLEQAADQRYAPAFDILGLMYAKGLGVPKDEIQAYARFSVAVALGHKAAEKNVAEMDRVLSPVQKITAQALAERLLN